MHHGASKYSKNEFFKDKGETNSLDENLSQENPRHRSKPHKMSSDFIYNPYSKTIKKDIIYSNIEEGKGIKINQLI